MGCNGKGKTTLVNLIIGLNQDYSGNIFYNNVNIEDLDLYYMRKNLFGITEQEPNLINDSIRNNLTFGDSSLSDETIKKYISNLGISSFILDLPNKLDYEISDKNSNISGGEKQKISLLKAFVKNPDIIIFFTLRRRWRRCGIPHRSPAAFRSSVQIPAPNIRRSF
ncbi:hypothetical protein SDC9_177493 [bioreactor metagenome]|uniref:ABC transporter domain-containing protein n=1 Tax=bioreactor metagenome TaxID=1076179 RepID=A0A645GUV8_9ZZZZ